MLSKEKATRSKSDRPEDSVLFSLKELRRLEDDRVKAEADARLAKAEAERRAKAEAEERARAEEREDRLRLEEAERRARVEGELRLREQQLTEEQRQRQQRQQQSVPERRLGRSAWIAAAAGAALIVAAGGGLASWASRQHQAEKKALEEELARRDEQARAAQADFDAKIRALEDRARRDVNEAKTAKEQARILGDLQRQRQAIEATRPRPPRRTAPATAQPAVTPPKPPFRLPQKPRIDDDPLGELPATKPGSF